MTKKEMELLTYYQLRNHIGAMALRDNKESVLYRSLYKRIRKDSTKRYLAEVEDKWNNEFRNKGYLSLYDVLEDLGVDVEYEKFLIKKGIKGDIGWIKEVH